MGAPTQTQPLPGEAPARAAVGPLTFPAMAAAAAAAAAATPHLPATFLGAADRVAHLPLMGPRRAPRNKREFYVRWLALEFGNRPRAYLSADDLAQDVGFDGLVSVRSLVPGGPASYMVPARAVRDGSVVFPHNVIFQESMPDEHLRIQGSVRRDVMGLELEFSTTPGLKFREAVERKGSVARGLQAVMVLRAHLDPTGLDLVMRLLDVFPDAVVEFACYNTRVGVLHQHTVVFEVRAY